MHALHAAHLAGVAAWGGALLLITFLVWRRARRRAPGLGHERRLYRYLAAPGFLAVALTGVWAIHQEPALLKEASTQVKLGLVTLLMVVDHLTLRCADQPLSPPRRYAVLHVVAVGLFVGAAAL